MIFLDNIHKNNYAKLMSLARINSNDIEREALFYIISGNDDLFKKCKYIYNFEENCIISNVLTSNKVDLTTSSKALIRLAFNLYNGFKDNNTDPLNLFYSLDYSNYRIASYAMNIRFNMFK